MGKTAIAEGLAQKIYQRDVPYKLLDKEVYLLDLTALVAGTQFRGQFESRMKGLIEEIKKLGNIILVIDEVHNLSLIHISLRGHGPLDCRMRSCAMNDAIIKTEELRFAYAEEGAVNPFVLDGVSLDIEEGSFVAVLGHNGSGKSTLAKHLNAILLPSGGKVYVDGIDTADEDKLLDIRRTVGMVFQNPDNQIVANVVEEDVAFAPENLGVPPAEIRRRVDDALKAVGMYLSLIHIFQPSTSCFKPSCAQSWTPNGTVSAFIPWEIAMSRRSSTLAVSLSLIHI